MWRQFRPVAFFGRASRGGLGLACGYVATSSDNERSKFKYWKRRQVLAPRRTRAHALCESSNDDSLRDLYPNLEPLSLGMLPTRDGKHTLYYEVSGNPAGKPAIFLHGGPGDGCSTKHRRLFDPSIFKIVTFDQRGAGKSIPVGSVDSNTTDHLVEDIEQLREHLEIDSWDLLVGGSWGSSLALAYAQSHPRQVRAMVLYSIFLPSTQSIEWLYGNSGAAKFYPDAYEKFICHLPSAERASPVEAYYKRMIAAEESVRFAALQRHAEWALTCLALTPDTDFISNIVAQPENIGTGSIIEMHYMRHNCFMSEDQLLKNCHIIGHLPCAILHGRYDMICAPSCAWQLHQALPLSTLQFVPESGHSSSAAPRLRSAIIEAINGHS